MTQFLNEDEDRYESSTKSGSLVITQKQVIFHSGLEEEKKTTNRRLVPPEDFVAGCTVLTLHP